MADFSSNRFIDNVSSKDNLDSCTDVARDWKSYYCRAGLYEGDVGNNSSGLTIPSCDP
jgi:hypothetical protein